MLIMCDYYGMCDEYGKCVGHSVKVTNEYGRMIKELGVDIKLICSPCIADGADTSLFKDVVKLPNNISIIGNSIGKRISDKLKLFRNIKIALRNEGTIFFYQVDFFFFLYIKLFYKKKPGRRIVILIYHQDFTGGRFAGTLHKIYQSALRKIDGIIYTQKGAEILCDNAVWMPDFVYRNDIYEKYQLRHKNDRVVCLGTINRYKQIEQLIDIWREHKDLPKLIIAGRFDTKERFESVCNDLPDNVTIKDELLKSEEYMTLLSESKYSILPYDMEQYKNRTSGVLLESIYCRVIPIAPRKLLEQNKLPGIGYEDMSEISRFINNDLGQIAEQFRDIYSEYGIEYAKGVLKDTLI